MTKFKPLENLQNKVDILEEELAEMQGAQEITQEESESGSNS